jgi:hypothetical protein
MRLGFLGCWGRFRAGMHQVRMGLCLEKTTFANYIAVLLDAPDRAANLRMDCCGCLQAVGGFLNQLGSTLYIYLSPTLPT